MMMIEEFIYDGKTNVNSGSASYIRSLFYFFIFFNLFSFLSFLTLKFFVIIIICIF